MLEGGSEPTKTVWFNGQKGERAEEAREEEAASLPGRRWALVHEKVYQRQALRIWPG